MVYEFPGCLQPSVMREFPSLISVGNKLVIGDGHGRITILEYVGQDLQMLEIVDHQVDGTLTPCIVLAANDADGSLAFIVFSTSCEGKLGKFQLSLYQRKTETFILHTIYGNNVPQYSCFIAPTEYIIGVCGGYMQSKEEDQIVPQEQPQYRWRQNYDIVTVIISADVNDVYCDLSDNKLNLQSGSIKVEGELFDSAHDFNWKIEGHEVHVNIKKQNNVRWTHLFSYDDGIGEDLDEHEQRVIQEQMEKFVGDSKEEEESVQFFHIDASGVEMRRSAPHILLCTTFDNDLCVKRSVDGIIYSFKSGDGMHVDTVDAFAYILASKREKRLVKVKGSTGFILEPQKRLFVYEKKGNHYGRQKVMEFGGGRVDGALHWPNGFAILTETSVILYK